MPSMPMRDYLGERTMDRFANEMMQQLEECLAALAAVW